MQAQKLRIAIQKSGRLSDDSLALLASCGLKFTKSTGLLKSVVQNFNAEILFLRDDDIPGYVADGVAHIGLVGQNVVEEMQFPVDILQPLGFGKCKLCIAIPKAEYSDSFKINDLDGKDIATSYPVIVKKYLDNLGINAKVHTISGSVEIAPSIGLSHAICDIVSSGSTLMANGLVAVDTVFQSEAVLISNQTLSEELKELTNQLVFRIKAVLAASSNKYIMLNVPNSAIPEITALLPGINSPTIMPLVEEGWSSLHSVIEEDNFWQIIEQLKAAGAKGILVCPIEKMIN